MAEPPSSRRDLRALKHDDRDLIRVLILDPWFRVVVASLVVVVVGTLVSLPKIWRMTPAGFRPQIRTSLLNLAQAWQLKRSARLLESQGRTGEAAEAWSAAFAKNVADLGSVREALRCTLAISEPPPRVLSRVARMPAWLLYASRTNDQDVILVAQYYDKTGQPEEVYNLLEPLKDHLSSQQEIAYLKSLIEQEAWEQYAERWRRVEQELSKDQEFALYHTGYLAARGPLEGRDAARRRLVEAAENPVWRKLALRLLLLRCAAVNDVPGYVEVLGGLVEARADRLRDHIAHWTLLAGAGRTEEARTAAEQNSTPPQTPREVIALARAYEGLGMKEQADRVLRQAVNRAGDDIGPAMQAFWLQWANSLIRGAEWRRLVGLVEELRSRPALVQAMGGWVYVVEGQAQHGLQHHDQASQAFEAAVRRPFPTPILAFDSAIEMKRLGYVQPALDLLLLLEKDFKDDPRYWRAVYQVTATAKQDPVLLLKAATEVRRRNPTDPLADFQYAAALLLNRLNPAEAVVLTLRSMNRAPDLPEAKVNHCLALAQNQRFDEAADLLRQIDASRFDEFGQTVFQKAVLSVALGQNDLAAARRALAQIQTQHLWPQEVQWLEQVRRERLGAGARVGEGGG